MRCIHVLVGLALATVLAVDAPLAGAAPDDFACSVSAPTPGNVVLEWTDIGQGYNIRHLIDGTDQWIKTVDSTTTSTSVPSAFGTYKVIGHDGTGKVSTTCEGPAGQPDPVGTFVCSVTAAASTMAVEWTDLGTKTAVDRYVVFQYIGDVPIFSVVTTGTSFERDISFGDVIVQARRRGTIVAQAECPGPPLPDFSCTVHPEGSVSWPEIIPTPDFFFVWVVRDGVAVELVGGEFGYGGTAIGVSPFGEYEVRYWYEGVRVSTRCRGAIAEPFSCRVSDGEVTWPKRWARIYVVRQQIGGSDIFIDRTGQTSTSLSNDYGKFTVSYSLYGETITASCDGTPLDDFVCQVDGDELSWTDQQAGIYHLRQTVDGTDRYIGNSAETIWHVDDPRGTFEVIHRRDRQTFRTNCSA